MDSYIVRIYRRGEDKKKEMAGTVEEMGAEVQNIFHSSHDLIDILAEEHDPGESDKSGMKPKKTKE